MKIPNFPGLFFDVCEGGTESTRCLRAKPSKSRTQHSCTQPHSGRRSSSKGKGCDQSRHRRRSSSEQRKSRRGSNVQSKENKKKLRRKKGDNTKSGSVPLLPSPAYDGPTKLAMESIEKDEAMTEYYALAHAPSLMMSGPVVTRSMRDTSTSLKTYGSTDTSLIGPRFANSPKARMPPNVRNDDVSEAVTNSPFSNLQGYYHNQNGVFLRPSFGYYNFGQQINLESHLPPTEDDGVEPVITQTPHHLDINVRDDQIWLSFKACFARKGFSHCVAVFVTSGIVINTLSTFMDYLVRLQGAPRKYVGIVGGTFQLLIMVASMMFGSWTDKSRKYYFVIVALLISGAFMLAVCSVDLDDDRGSDLRLALLAVAVLAGPLQPLSTELGVEVVYPLSENTVLVIQQLFSNLLSALFIPVFKMLRNVRTTEIAGLEEVPDYTFSFYLLVIIHACTTFYFASFNGIYLRYEEEVRKKQENETIDIKVATFSNVESYQPWLPPGRMVGDESYPFLIPQEARISY